MTQAEQEVIDLFCRELALALRRITGKNIEIHPEDMILPIELDRERPENNQKTDEELSK